MDDITQRKIVAGGKLLIGAGRMVNGVATAFGEGIVGVVPSSPPFAEVSNSSRKDVV